MSTLGDTGGHLYRYIEIEIIDNSQLIDEFERLYKGFKFVDSWDDPEIIPEMFRIYARNVPVKEASRNFIYCIEILHSKINRNQRKSIYLQRCMYSNQEWSPLISTLCRL